MAKKLIDLKIDRRRWRRGDGYGATCLLDREGQKCCLGFLATRCGVRLERGQTEDYGHLEDEQAASLPTSLVVVDSVTGATPTKLHGELVDANDSEKLRGKEREAEITRLMRQAGVRVTFVG